MVSSDASRRCDAFLFLFFHRIARLSQVCDDWLARLRPHLAALALRLGCHADAVRHGAIRLADLARRLGQAVSAPLAVSPPPPSGLAAPSPPTTPAAAEGRSRELRHLWEELERCLEGSATALVALREPEALAGLASWHGALRRQLASAAAAKGAPLFTASERSRHFDGGGVGGGGSAAAAAGGVGGDPVGEPWLVGACLLAGGRAEEAAALLRPAATAGLCYARKRTQRSAHGSGHGFGHGFGRSGSFAAGLLVQAWSGVGDWGSLGEWLAEQAQECSGDSGSGGGGGSEVSGGGDGATELPPAAWGDPSLAEALGALPPSSLSASTHQQHVSAAALELLGQWAELDGQVAAAVATADAPQTTEAKRRAPAPADAVSSAATGNPSAAATGGGGSSEVHGTAHGAALLLADAAVLSHCRRATSSSSATASSLAAARTGTGASGGPLDPSGPALLVNASASLGAALASLHGFDPASGDGGGGGSGVGGLRRDLGHFAGAAAALSAVVRSACSGPTAAAAAWLQGPLLALPGTGAAATASAGAGVGVIQNVGLERLELVPGTHDGGPWLRLLAVHGSLSAQSHRRSQQTQSSSALARAVRRSEAVVRCGVARLARRQGNLGLASRLLDRLEVIAAAHAPAALSSSLSSGQLSVGELAADRRWATELGWFCRSERAKELAARGQGTAAAAELAALVVDLGSEDVAMHRVGAAASTDDAGNAAIGNAAAAQGRALLELVRWADPAAPPRDNGGGGGGGGDGDSRYAALAWGARRGVGGFRGFPAPRVDPEAARASLGVALDGLRGQDRGGQLLASLSGWPKGSGIAAPFFASAPPLGSTLARGLEVGRGLGVACSLAPSNPTAWLALGEWCFRAAHHALAASAAAANACSASAPSSLEAAPEEASAHGAARGAPEALLASCVAAHARFLRLNGHGVDPAAATTAALRLLKILVDHGPAAAAAAAAASDVSVDSNAAAPDISTSSLSLSEALAEAFCGSPGVDDAGVGSSSGGGGGTGDAHPACPPVWLRLAPQLLARLGHPSPTVGRYLVALLARVAAAAPHALAVPVLAGSADHGISGDGGVRLTRFRLLREVLSGARQASGDLDHPLGTASAGAAQGAAAAQSAVLGSNEVLLRELTRLSVLWDEAWARAASHLANEADARCRTVERDLHRLNRNPVKCAGTSLERIIFRLHLHPCRSQVHYFFERLSL